VLRAPVSGQIWSSPLGRFFFLYSCVGQQHLIWSGLLAGRTGLDWTLRRGKFKKRKDKKDEIKKQRLNNRRKDFRKSNRKQSTTKGKIKKNRKTPTRC
jgi:hypothetical protein